MEDMYNANAYTTSSSTGGGGGGAHRSSDDISLFLNQIMHRSSLYSSVSSPTTPFSSSFAAPLSIQRESYPNSLKCGSTLVKEGIYCLDSGNGVNVGHFSGNVTGNGGGNTSSFSIGGVSENEIDECDCESEEGLEAFVEELPAKPTATRSSSKRSRAAEVHNLSEKRRRSRINEKMKALQNLIPNSNKTDKASMLDEAIEYLKQLQLQVQMLSMRNGVSLHPMCLPRLLQPIQHSQFSRGISEENNRSQQMNIVGSVPLDQENTEQTLYDLPNPCTVSNQLSLPNMSTLLNSEASMGIDLSVRAHFDPFPLPAASGEIGRENSLPHQYLNADHSARIPPVEVAKATVSRAFETQASFLKDGSSLGAWMIGRDQSECVFPKNIEYSLILSPSLQASQGTQAGSSAGGDEIKVERHHI